MEKMERGRTRPPLSSIGPFFVSGHVIELLWVYDWVIVYTVVYILELHIELQWTSKWPPYRCTLVNDGT